MSVNPADPRVAEPGVGRPDLSPALRACLERAPGGFILGLVQVWRVGDRFRLAHREDGPPGARELRRVPVGELRELAGFSAEGVYRPLKSAPTLRRGWEALAEGPLELETALDRLHPGGLADWHAWVAGRPFESSLREAAARQTGRYRGIRDLDDAELQRGVDACCSPGGCVKQRAWRVPGEGPLQPPGEPALVCLDPCPFLWDTLRAAAEVRRAAEGTS